MHLQLGQTAQVEARVVAVERGFRFRPMLKVTVEDDSLRQLSLRFFHYSAQSGRPVHRRQAAALLRQVRLGTNSFEMVHPSYRFIAAEEAGVCKDRLDPLYSNYEGIGAATLAKLVQQSLRFLPDDGSLELLPAENLETLGLAGLAQSLQAMHQPDIGTSIGDLLSGRHPAIKRLAFEELMAHHLSLRQKRSAMQVETGQKHPCRFAGASGGFCDALPFRLTQAQRTVHR